MTDTARTLAELRDIQLPAPVPEPTVELFVVAILLIALGLLVALALFKRRKSPWAAVARDEINRLRHEEPEQAIAGYATVLKQLAITVSDQPEVRQLHGTPWLEYLDHFFRTRYFTNGAGQIFGGPLYRPQSESDQSPQKLSRQLARKLSRLIRRRGRRLC